MLNHLANCHGEWTVLFGVVTSLPLLGAWLRSKVEKGDAER